MSTRSAISSLTIGALVAAGCCKPVPAPLPPPKEITSHLLWRDVEVGSSAKAAELFQRVKERYGSARSYRDRGVMTFTMWNANGRSTEFSRFETIFVRGVGLRFRFYDEQNLLRVGIRHVDGETTLHFLGTTKRVSLADAVEAARGATYDSVRVVPALLSDSISAPDHWRGTLGLAGVAPIGCGGCRLVAFETPEPIRQSVIGIDESALVIRRFQMAQVVPPTHGAGFAMDALLIYQAEIDLANHAGLEQELRAETWP